MPQMDISKEVRYLNKDFVSFRNALINFSKVYFPDSYKDFNESSLGMMFMEMSSYVGDVLSYYLDSNLKEAILLYAEENKNVIYLAQSLGYKNKTTVPGSTDIDFYQQIPAVGTAGENPDFRYALKIAENAQVQSTVSPNIFYRTTEPIDFSNYQTQDFTATVYTADSTGKPLVYLLRKRVPAIAGTISTTQFGFAEPQAFQTVVLPFTDVIEILDVTDSDGNKWYEVDYLAQDTVFVDEVNDSNHVTGQSTADQLSSPYILKLKRVSKRFITRKTVEGFTQMQFGSGISAFPDQVLIPTPQTVNTFISQFTFVDVANNFLNTRTYGLSPSNTVLTVRFTRGGGIESNVPQNDLTRVSSITYNKTEDDFVSADDKRTYGQMKNTLAVSNTEPASGGRGAETIEEIRQNAISFFAAQDRCVTYQDYIARSLAMPAKYGNVSKAFIRKSSDNFAIDLYVLGFDYQGHLAPLSNTVKNNLATYLSSFRELTSAVNIKDAFIVNIGVNFSILTNPKFNKNDVILGCINQIQSYFDINQWQVNQPIILSDIFNFLDNVDGVRTVIDVTIFNKYSTAGFTEYSNNYYNIKAAMTDDVIYPSLDPCIFEVKYPNIDIEGQAK
jgi:hypothetical protein